MPNQVRIDTSNMPRAEWLRLRQRGLGGSDVSVCMDVNPYKTRFELYTEKIAEEPPEMQDNDFLYFGRLLEPAILQAFVDKTGMKIADKKEMVFHEDYPWMYANTDSVIVENGKDVGVVECKNISGAVYKYWDEAIPIYYYSQLQNYLEVLDLPFGYFALLIDGHKFDKVGVERDQEFINEMYSDCSKFWNGNVVSRVEPDLVVVDFEKRIVDEESIFVGDSDILMTYGALMEARDKKKKYEAREKELGGVIKQAMGEKALLKFNDHLLATWKSSTVNRFEQKRFKKDHPDLASGYSKESTERKFLVKELKNDDPKN